MPTLELVLKIDGTERAAVAIPARFVRYLLSDHRIPVARAKTQADKATALLAWITTQMGMANATSNPGTNLGDWLRKRLGAARGLNRDLTPEEFAAEGSNALWTELDTTDPAADVDALNPREAVEA